MNEGKEPEVQGHGKEEANNTSLFARPWKGSDAVLIVEDKELHVHTTVLSLASPVFDKMFNGGFKEAQTKRVTLEGKNYALVEKMLETLYPNIKRSLEINYMGLCSNCGSTGSIVNLDTVLDTSVSDGKFKARRIASKGDETCERCQQYFQKETARREENLINLENLFGLAKEYLVEPLMEKVRDEILRESNLITNKEYAISLLKKAEKMNCPKAMDNCIRLLANHSDGYVKVCSICWSGQTVVEEKGIKKELDEKQIGLESGNKIKGLLLQKHLKAVQKYTDHVDWKKISGAGDRTMQKKFLETILDDMQAIADDLTIVKL